MGHGGATVHLAQLGTNLPLTDAWSHCIWMCCWKAATNEVFWLIIFWLVQFWSHINRKENEKCKKEVVLWDGKCVCLSYGDPYSAMHQPLCWFCLSCFILSCFFKSTNEFPIGQNVSLSWSKAFIVGGCLFHSTTSRIELFPWPCLKRPSPVNSFVYSQLKSGEYKCNFLTREIGTAIFSWPPVG